MLKEDGYKTVISKNSLKLSSEEVQRITITRVILKNSLIIILDKATAALNLATKARL